MPVFYTRHPADSSLTTLATRLHANLIAAGWEHVYSNADAIGTGTASSPAWTKAAAASTSAGVSVYRMPLSGLTNRWYVRVEWAWGSAGGAQIYPKITTGTGWDAGGSVITGAGTAFAANDGHANNTTETFVVTNENGLMVFLNTGAGTGWFLGLERRRSIGNTVIDDVVTYAYASTGRLGFTGNGPRNVVRNWALGEYAEQPLVVLSAVTGATVTTGVSPSTLSSADGNVGYPCGFFSSSNGLGGILRLIQLWLNADNAAGAEQSVEIDGASRLYFAAARLLTPGGQSLLIAKA
ncbi:hypothetical protein [Deinococcus yunweiensis]|uniref:hypothetical protein n=1 Tax=Deinococcus yunweiensis TaxID=367282 RepID=UPI00398F4D7B